MLPATLSCFLRVEPVGDGVESLGNHRLGCLGFSTAYAYTSVNRRIWFDLPMLAHAGFGFVLPTRARSCCRKAAAEACSSNLHPWDV
jgi:hypothetical protein